jgi:hypothetical protein
MQTVPLALCPWPNYLGLDPNGLDHGGGQV